MNLFTNIEDKFSIDVLDKWNVFVFYIIRMPHLTHNIPSKMFYVAHGIETLRTARVTSTETNLK